MFPQTDRAPQPARRTDSLAGLREAAAGDQRDRPDGILQRIKRFFIN
jgi:hypothetical protein